MGVLSWNIFNSDNLSPQSNDRVFIEDFLRASSFTNTYTLATAGAASFATQDGETKHDGIVRLRVSTPTVSKIAGVMATNMIGNFNGSFQKYSEHAFRIVNASTLASKYYFSIGFCDLSSELSLNNNIVSILYDPHNASGLNGGLITNFILITRNGLLNTTITNTGVAVGSDWCKFGLLYNEGVIQVYYNDDAVASTSSNIPTFAGAPKLTLGFQMSRNSSGVAAAAQDIYLDYTKFYSRNG